MKQAEAGTPPRRNAHILVHNFLQKKLSILPKI
jgi:hypothetical protein